MVLAYVHFDNTTLGCFDQGRLSFQTRYDRQCGQYIGEPRPLLIYDTLLLHLLLLLQRYTMGKQIITNDSHPLTLQFGWIDLAVATSYSTTNKSSESFARFQRLPLMRSNSNAEGHGTVSEDVVA